MTIPAAARRGEIFPAFTLQGVEGPPVALEAYRARTNLVLVFGADEAGRSPVTGLLGELVAQSHTLRTEVAQVVVVVSSPPAADLPLGQERFPVVLDEGARVHREAGATDAAGNPAPAVFVTDRFREIFAAYLPEHGSALPTAQEIIEWLVFINIQCPECGAPEWPR
jgi:peroxiredoxin